MASSSTSSVSFGYHVLLWAVYVQLMIKHGVSGYNLVDRLLLDFNRTMTTALLVPGYNGYCGWNYQCATAVHALLLDEYLSLSLFTSVDDSNGIKRSIQTLLQAATIFPQPGARINFASYIFTPGDRIGLFGALYYSSGAKATDAYTQRKIDAIRANVEDRVLHWPLQKGVFARSFGWNSYVIDFFLMFVRQPSFLYIEDCFVGGYPLITTHPDALSRMLVSYHTVFRDPEDGLWWHGLFVKRDGSVINNGVKWARGNGWFLLAISTFLLQTDAAFVDRITLVNIFLDQLQNLLQFQRPSGAFGVIVNDSASPDESSLVSIYIFSVGAAVRLGLLNSESDEATAAEKAWNWLLQRTYSNLTLSDTNAGQELSFDPEKYIKNVGQSDGSGVVMVFYASMGHRMLEMEQMRG